MRIAIVSDLHIGYERFEADAFAQAKEALELAKTQADAILRGSCFLSLLNVLPAWWERCPVFY